MGHERAQANMEIVFDWLNAMRHRDLDAFARLFHPDVVWTDVGGNVACDGREQVLRWLGSRSPEQNEVDAIELLADDGHAVLGVRDHAREELAGVALEDGQSFTVFTFQDGQIVGLRGHVHRDDALAVAGIRDFRWR